MTPEHTGLAGWWAQADGLAQGLALLLLLMSMASWLIVLGKLWLWLRLRHAAQQLESFWASPTLSEGVEQLRRAGSGNPFAQLVERGEAASQHLQSAGTGSLATALDGSDFLTRALRQSMGRSQQRLESGLTLLASVGATAPFVGLFGTVWGIQHALVRIGATGRASLDVVAGPVGEALIMTAAGLAVAIPAVLAYNAFGRANRVILAELDALAHDLHAYLTTGARLNAAKVA